MNRTIIVESRVSITTFAELVIFYQKKTGTAFRTRSEAISFILETQLALLKEQHPGYIRELTEEEAVTYLGITVGQNGLFNRRKAAQAFAKEMFSTEQEKLINMQEVERALAEV
jgi:hypothetical protein